MTTSLTCQYRKLARAKQRKSAAAAQAQPTLGMAVRG
jgi:hypothetical protein